MRTLTNSEIQGASGGEYYTGDIMNGTLEVHFYNGADAAAYCGLTAFSMMVGLPTPGYAVTACYNYYA